MITSTAETEQAEPNCAAPTFQRTSKEPRKAGLLWLPALLLAHALVHGQPALGPWTPLFKGVDRAVGTNTPGVSGNFPIWQVVHCIRVDLTDPDIRLFSSPRAPNYSAEYNETLTQTVPQFLYQYQVQVAADANFYSANPGGSDPGGSGLPCEIFGLAMSTGTVVSAQTTADAAGNPRYASLLFTTNNEPRFAFVNRPPGTNTTGMFTAITGYYPVVSNGVNIGNAVINAYPDSTIHQRQPRTAFGISKDNRYLFLMSIDGRQSGYSEGALDTETAYWQLKAGAWNAINMDGGGSTALYAADSTGNPVPVNHSSYVAAYGHERYIGSHFGVYAKPVPGFINDVTVSADDTAAAVTWTTIAPANSQVQYGLTSNLGSASALSPSLVTNHSVLLTNLTPGAGYYFQVLSTTAGGSLYGSSNFFFVTSNYMTTNLLFDLTNTWTYSTADLDGANWPAPGYDDTAWDGSGPGVLWVDIRGSAQPGIPEPNTQMPPNPNTGYPFITYYFRTHFVFDDEPSGTWLVFHLFIDDGAVFYLNGQEIARPFMPPYPAAIANATLAAAYNCSSGDATCPYDFALSGDLVTNLVRGDNVLAVEMHNYSAKSPDITFGAALSYAKSFVPQPQITVDSANGTLTLSWDRAGFILQQAEAPTGPWIDVPGPVFVSPVSMPTTGTAQYFRLRK